ncbi:MAG: flagellar basal body P-ring protein FlgI [Myxococcaceae bacterium]|nr:flagellar basal body P-ring protein FlgI [Myxococcaceae bacterium]
MGMRAAILLLAVAWVAVPLSAGAATVRLKELVTVQGMRDNELYGYGLVMGLAGTGDSEQVFFTSQSLSGMLGRLGIRVDAREIRSRNVAAVMVTARLPTFSRPGSRLDVQVSSMGNARSLAGGVLLLTPLTGADGAVYALAQGSVQVGGYEVAAFGSLQRKNQTTAGRVPSGATVEKAVAAELSKGPVVLGLKRPDFTTASRVAAAVEQALGAGAARAADPASVEITPPEEFKSNPIALVAKLEALEVEADQRAKVVVSERTGTVVAGEHVRIRPAAVAHGGLQVSIAARPEVSQPAPFSRRADTVVTTTGEVSAQETKSALVKLPGTSTVEDLVKALNALGATPRDLVSIFQALDAAGALDAELEVI